MGVIADLVNHHSAGGALATSEESIGAHRESSTVRVCVGKFPVKRRPDGRGFGSLPLPHHRVARVLACEHALIGYTAG